MEIVKVPSEKKYKKLEEAMLTNVGKYLDADKVDSSKKWHEEVLPKAVKWLKGLGLLERGYEVGDKDVTSMSRMQAIDDAIKGVKKKAVKVHINQSGDMLAAIVDIDCDVDLHHMYISRIPQYVRFGNVLGSFNISDNELETMAGLPEEVSDVLNIGMNRIKNFDGTTCKYCGTLVGSKQKVKTDYILNQENYDLFLMGNLTENLVFVGPSKVRGELKSIDESIGVAYVKVEGELEAHRYALDEVYPMHGLTELLS